MNSFSEELSQQTYGFPVIQVNTCIPDFVWGQRRLEAMRTFHLFNHPKQHAFPCIPGNAECRPWTWGLLERKFTGYLVDIFSIPGRKGRKERRWAERNGKGKEGDRMGRGNKNQPLLEASDSVVVWIWSPQRYVAMCSFLFVRIIPILSSFERVVGVLFCFVLFSETHDSVGG